MVYRNAFNAVVNHGSKFNAVVNHGSKLNAVVNHGSKFNAVVNHGSKFTAFNAVEATKSNEFLLMKITAFKINELFTLRNYSLSVNIVPSSNSTTFST